MGTRNNLLNIVQKINSEMGGDIEIIIVYDRFLTEVLSDTQNMNNVKLILNSSGNLSPGRKRNIGAECSSGEILIFMDDDVDPDSSLFRFLKSDSDISHIVLPEIKTEIDIPFPLGDHVSGRAMVTACMIIRRSIFFETGEFNTLLFNYREDSEFFIRAVKKGFSVVFENGVYVNHPVRITDLSTFRIFFTKNSYEPLFHKLVNGEYAHVIESRPWSSSANRIGISAATYFLLALLVVVISLLITGNVTALIAIVSALVLLTVSSVLTWNFAGESLVRSGSYRVFRIPLYIAYIVTIIPARIFGSLKWRHFTL